MDSHPRRSRSPRDNYRARSPSEWSPPMRQRMQKSPYQPPPASYGRRPSRRRSRSPIAIDRYLPGREYVPPRHDEYRRRASPPPNIDRYVPGQDSAPPRDVPLFNPIPDPLALESQAGFTYFMEWWRKEQEIKEEKERIKTGARRPLPRLKGEQESREERERDRAKVQAAYDAYKEKYTMQMAKAFVHLHKDEEWFKERYDPDIRDPLRLRINDFRKGQFQVWTTDLDNGAFDEFTLEGIYKNDSNGAGGVVEKEEGEAMAATEVLGVSDLVPSKGADLRDEAALQPALLIKTIAPHVSHEQLENFCKEHLGEGEGGFRWLSLSDPNPTKKFHRIGWVLLSPADDPPTAPDTVINDREDNNGDADGTLDGTEKGNDAEKPTGGYVDRALTEINGKSIEDETRGNFQCHVGVHVPQSAPRKKALWDLFSAPERVERDLELAERLVSKLEQELGEDINGVTKIEERVEHLRAQGFLQPPTKGKESKGDADMRDAEEDEDGEVEENEEGAADDDADDEELVLKKKKLDLLIEYLRRVFNFCFFCVFESDSVHELGRKCPGGHLRRPRATLTSSAKTVAKASAYGEEFPLRKQPGQDERANEGDEAGARPMQFQKNNKNHLQLQRAFNWVKTYEDKLFQILEPDSADLAKLGGKPLPEAEEDEMKKFVSREDENKFRCKVPDCTKLFKSETYWQTHVQRRHEEWLAKFKKELLEINNYVLDPAHIVPSRNDANSTGHFVPNSQMASGTPRNFSLHSVGPGGVGQIGAMRSGRGRPGARQAGPYDRLPQDSRNARWRGAGGGGRIDGARGPRPAQPHPDALAVGGGGSRDATAGRSLKSYEDLDAVGGSSNGALDY